MKRIISLIISISLIIGTTSPVYASETVGDVVMLESENVSENVSVDISDTGIDDASLVERDFSNNLELDSDDNSINGITDNGKEATTEDDISEAEIEGNAGIGLDEADATLLSASTVGGYSFAKLNESQYSINGKKYDITGGSFTKTDLANGISKYSYVDNGKLEICVYKGTLKTVATNRTYHDRLDTSKQEVKRIAICDFSLGGNTMIKSLFDSFDAYYITFGNNFDTSGLNSMESMFTCCTANYIDVSCFNTANVNTMKYMIESCNSLKTVDVSGFDTSNVTNMYGMFNSNKSLKEIVIDGIDTSQVEDMSYMFSGNTLLEYVDVSGFDTSKVTKMHYMFA